MGAIKHAEMSLQYIGTQRRWCDRGTQQLYGMALAETQNDVQRDNATEKCCNYHTKPTENTTRTNSTEHRRHCQTKEFFVAYSPRTMVRYTSSGVVVGCGGAACCLWWFNALVQIRCSQVSVATIHVCAFLMLKLLCTFLHGSPLGVWSLTSTTNDQPMDRDQWSSVNGHRAVINGHVASSHIILE